MLKPKLDSASKDEGELTAAKRLLQQLHKPHRYFADVIVYDALASNATWISHKTTTKKITISVWETTVKMKGVTEPLRFIKFLEKTTDCNTNKSKYNQVFFITTAHYMAVKTLHKIIHAR